MMGTFVRRLWPRPRFEHQNNTFCAAQEFLTSIHIFAFFCIFISSITRGWLTDLLFSCKQLFLTIPDSRKTSQKYPFGPNWAQRRLDLRCFRESEFALV